MGLYIGNTRYCPVIGRSLPYDAEIEYLESTGAYIILPHGIDSTTHMRIEFMMGSSTNNRFLFGSADGWQVKMTMLGASGNSYSFRYGNSAISIANSYAPYNSKNLFLKNGTSFTLGSYSFTGSTYSKTIQNTFLFSGTSSGNNAMSAGNNIRIYSFFMSNADYQVALIPVRVGTTGYMYDKINGQLFGNAGTGSFVLGPDVT